MDGHQMVSPAGMLHSGLVLLAEKEERNVKVLRQEKEAA
jgi:hypothetical protein